MLLALGEHLPGMRWTVPTGGFYVWLTMPDNLDSKAMLPRAVKELVAYTPGTAFYADGNGRNAMRLSFCYPTPEAIREGIRRLATVINGELALLDEFSQTGPRDPGSRRARGRPAPVRRLSIMANSLSRIVVLAGGISHERDVSLRSGRRVADGLSGHGLTVELRDPDASLLSALRADPPDVVWPALHGASGEDGALRGLLEFLGIPFVGSRSDAARLASDKPTARPSLPAPESRPLDRSPCPARRSGSSAPTRCSTRSRMSFRCRSSSSPPVAVRPRG